MQPNCSGTCNTAKSCTKYSQNICSVFLFHFHKDFKVNFGLKSEFWRLNMNDFDTCKRFKNCWFGYRIYSILSASLWNAWSFPRYSHTCLFWPVADILSFWMSKLTSKTCITLCGKCCKGWKGKLFSVALLL